MEYNNLVSIIVPIYNAEKHLKNCIDSILNQTYKNIEVILINDGSTDNSSNICEDFAKNDFRIKVISQENSGPSKARNRGIITAVGKYIQFVDSDDKIEPNMIEKLVAAMNINTQLVICGINLLKLKNGNFINEPCTPSIDGIYESSEFLNYFSEFYKNCLINSPCNKLFETDVIKKNKVEFKEDISIGEDLLFNLKYINVCSNISIIKEELYNYMLLNNEYSLTNSYKKNYFENQQMLFHNLRDFLLEKNSYKGNNKDLIGETYTNSIVNCFINLFHKDSNLTPKNTKKQIQFISDDVDVKEHINYFTEGNIQKRITGFLIKSKYYKGIYWFYKVKSVLQNNFKPIFLLLKNLNK